MHRLKLLLDHGADIEARGCMQRTAIELAKAWQHKEVVQILEKYSRDKIVG